MQVFNGSRGHVCKEAPVALLLSQKLTLRPPYYCCFSSFGGLVEQHGREPCKKVFVAMCTVN